ncbi:MAG TPA: hypothetical protein VHC72_01810, partial [Bryobacteraceae bacterium]|nr:hypothetical protein [Bryobacteraceae bacterium]
PFWMTMPCGWRPVLVAKAVFLAVAIHLPYLISCAVIVQARGFSPLECVPELLYRQGALAALTLPSLAIACMVRNAAHFMMIVIVLMTAAAAPSMLAERPAAQDVRIALLILVIVAAGVAIALRQYRLRLTAQSRWIGGAALALAVAIWWMPRESFYGLASVLFPPAPGTSQLSIRYAGAARQADRPHDSYPGLRVVWIPIETTGYTGVRLEQAGLDLREQGGHSYGAAMHPSPDKPAALTAQICCGIEPKWQGIFVGPALMQQIGDRSVTVRGAALARFERGSHTSWIPVEQDQFVPNLGRCSSDIQWGDGNPNNAKLHVECESPHRLPSFDVTVVDPARGREWHDGVTDGDDFVSYLRGTWLSPMARRETYFSSATEEMFGKAGGKWFIPRDELRSVQIAITPGIPEGSRMVRYEIPNIRLRDFEAAQ